MRKIIACVLLSVVTGVVLPVAPQASAEIAGAHYVTVGIHLRDMQGSGKVIVYLEIAKDLSSLGIPQELDEVPLTTIPVSETGTLQIKLPVTKQS